VALVDVGLLAAVGAGLAAEDAGGRRRDVGRFV